MDTFSGLDKKMMSRALNLARRAKGSTFPNPSVGAVIAAGDTVVGEGATREWGGAHAERAALALAGERATGATLYVTLEPCCHHGRTPPCTEAIIRSGIRRVVASVNDPNPLVDGKGIAELRGGGVEVSTGLLEGPARELNEDFFFAITRKRAWVTLKLALTLDGCIADNQGDSRWITSERARKRAHELRRTHAGVVVGRGTLDKDDPRLDVRLVKGPSPARIVLSSGSAVFRERHFVRTAPSFRSIVAICSATNSHIDKDTRSGLEFWYTGETDRRRSLERLLDMAYAENLPSLLVEGGQQIASQFLEFGLVNRVWLFYGNKILGEGYRGFKFQNGLPIEKAISLDSIKIRTLGDNVVVTGTPVH